MGGLILKSIFSTLFFGSLIGSVVSLGVFCFIELINILTSVIRNKNFTIDSINDFFTLETIPLLLLPIIAGLVVGFLRSMELGNRWHGPPDVILSAHSSKEKT